jgi:DNA repair photolyase
MKSLRTIARKTLLYKCGVEYADYGLNHAEGCTHGCTYPCYAMMMKKRHGIISSYEDWIKPKIVSNALELLDKELPRKKDKINRVFMCFATDPFMFQITEIEQLSLKILERLNADNIKAVLISKGIYPEVLTNTGSFNPNNEYGSTIVSLSEDFRKKFEPNAAPIEERIRALRRLHKAGLKTWVSMEPYPTPDILKQDIREILEEISFVDKIVFGKWNYNSRISAFKSYKEFYNSMVLAVMKFRKNNLIGRNIEIHIKKGTRTAS